MFGERIVLLLLLLGLSAAFAPPKYRSNRRTTCKASADGENGDTSASTIHIALVGSDADELGLESMLSEHPFCQMTKIKLALETVPVTSSWDDDVVSSLQIYRTALNGGATELYAVGKYFDTVALEGGQPRLLSRHVKLDTRDLGWGTHLPL